MEKISRIVANTKIDKHGESLTFNSLVVLNNDAKLFIASSHHDHDFRNPPIARGIDSHIIGDSLYVTFEFFDLEDINKPNPNNIVKNKTLAIHRYTENSIRIVYDRNVESDNEILDDLDELQKAIDPDTPLGFELKKSLDPTVVITFIIAYVSKSFIDTLLSRLSDNLLDRFKKLIFKYRKKTKGEYVFTLIFQVLYEGKENEVLINFTNASAEEIKESLERNKQKIYNLMEYYKNNKIEVSRVVFNHTNKKLIHAYSVLSDGTPIDIQNVDRYKKLLKPYEAKNQQIDTKEKHKKKKKKGKKKK